MTTQTLINEQTPREPMSKDEPLAKEELERKKLVLEIKDLERPFWKRPSYVLAALPTFLAIAALAVGFVNGFFSAQLTKLENQKHDLKVEIREFESTRNSLISQNEQFRQELAKKQEGIKRIGEIIVNVQSTSKSMEGVITSGRTNKKGGIVVPNNNPEQKLQLLRMIQSNVMNELLSELATVAEDDRKQD